MKRTKLNKEEKKEYLNYLAYLDANSLYPSACVAFDYLFILDNKAK